MTEAPKELVAREMLARHYECADAPAGAGQRFHAANVRAIGKRDYADWKDHAAIAAMLEYGRLTADRERSVPEDVVERVARALAKHNYPGASERDIDEMWDGWAEDARAAIAATPPRIPEGFVLVPKVSTEAMKDAAADAWLSASNPLGRKASALWSAMIAAAPAPALPETGVER